MSIYQLGDDAPEVAATCYVAHDANVIGKVTLGEHVSVWNGVTMRGDNERISIGANSNVQENSVLHTDMGYPLTGGEWVTVGHMVMLHGCTIGDGALIGIGAVVLNNARIGKNCLVGAGALVTEGKEFADNSLIIGSPAKAVRTLSEQEVAMIRLGAQSYVQRGQQFLTELVKIA